MKHHRLAVDIELTRQQTSHHQGMNYVYKKSVLNHIIRKILIPIKRDRSIYILSIIICAFTYLIATYFDVPQQVKFTTYSRSFMYALAVTAFFACFLYFFYLLLRLEPRPLKMFWHKFVLVFKHWPEIINFWLLTFSMSIVLSSFTSLKTAIPSVVPFYLDPWLVHLDDLLHFGHQPWRLTHSLISTPEATAIINFLYNIWFFVVWCFLAFSMCIVWRPKLRQQMILSNCLIWFINGGILAMIFSSVGPPYVEHLFPDVVNFQTLFAQLHAQNDILLQQGTIFNIWALNVQEQLWDAYIHHTMAIGMGISAMPSVHVSTTTLIALSLYSLNKKAGILGWIYVFMIELGSIHLGWHYAIDGYAGMIFTIVIWKLVGYWQHRINKASDENT